MDSAHVRRRLKKFDPKRKGEQQVRRANGANYILDNKKKKVVLEINYYEVFLVRQFIK